MRRWIKQVMLECLKEVVQDRPLIVSVRPPEQNDIYPTGSMWRCGNRIWFSKKTTTEWEETNTFKE